jgi:hypothetical protein
MHDLVARVLAALKQPINDYFDVIGKVNGLVLEESPAQSKVSREEGLLRYLVSEGSLVSQY